MVNDRYPFDDLEDEKTLDGDPFLRNDRDKYLDPYDRPYYIPRGSSLPDYDQDNDEFNKTTRISRESLMAFSPEQSPFHEKYETDYYKKNYRIYPKERNPTSSLVSIKVNTDQGLDPIERYKKFKYQNERNPYKGRKRSFSGTKSKQPSSKPRGYRGKDVIYGKSKEESPIYRNERKKKRVNYKTLLPQTKLDQDNKVDTRRQQNEENEDKSYGYVKDHHGNTYFKVNVVILKIKSFALLEILQLI